jgi:hypothetical protein
MKLKIRMSSFLAALLTLTLLPLNAATAAQTRTVVGGTLYALRCNDSHDLQLGTLNAITGEFTNVGVPNLSSTTGINTCMNTFARNPTDVTGLGYVLSYSTNGLKIRIHTLNFATGAMSLGSQVIVDARDGSGNCIVGFTADASSYYVLFTKYYAGTYEGIFVAKINPVTRAVTESQLVANGSSLLANSAAACYVLSGFAYNPVDSKLYIATGNSDGGNRANGYYHLWSLNPNTGVLVDESVLPEFEIENSDGITPHSFFTMTFDTAGTIWGLANSSPKGLVSTQSATISGWSVPNNLSLSTARIKAAIEGENDQLFFVPGSPAAAPAAQTPAQTEAQVKAAAAVAAAKREAEVKTARADLSKTLEKADKLTADSFAKADIAGVTKENIAEVQAEILALPAELRTDINQVLKVARKFEVVGKIASEQATTLPISAFVEVGLIPTDSKNKVALIAAIRRASADSRDSFADIKAVIAAEAARIQDRKDRLAAAMNRLKTK